MVYVFQWIIKKRIRRRRCLLPPSLHGLHLGIRITQCIVLLDLRQLLTSSLSWSRLQVWSPISPLARPPEAILWWRVYDRTSTEQDIGGFSIVDSYLHGIYSMQVGVHDRETSYSLPFCMTCVLCQETC